jgi:hypothetical protein
MNSVYEQLLQIARRIVTEAESAGGKLSASRLANVMLDEIDPKKKSTEYVAYCARSSCVQLLGKVLRAEWGDENHPLGEKYTAQLEIKEFVSCLQVRYPVPHYNGEEYTEYTYLDDLTAEQVETITAKMDAIGDHWHKHADQLRRYHRSKIAKLVQ